MLRPGRRQRPFEDRPVTQLDHSNKTFKCPTPRAAINHHHWNKALARLVKSGQLAISPGREVSTASKPSTG